MKKKSFLFLARALSFAVLSLTGCNRGNSRNSGAEPTPEPASTPTQTPTQSATPTAAPSSGGLTWTAVSNSPFGTSDISAIAYGNNRFVAVGDDGKMAYAEW